MRLHYYTNASPDPYFFEIRHHHGQGFGSIFARLFSKVAAKTAAKTALSAAKVAGRKVLRVAAKQGSRLAKEAARTGVEELKKVGKDLAVQGIDALAQTAINKGVPSEIVHNVSTVARDGAKSVVDKIGNTAAPGSILQHQKPKVNSSRRAIPSAVAGSKIQNHKKRKRSRVSLPSSSAKRFKYNLQNDIDES